MAAQEVRTSGPVRVTTDVVESSPGPTASAKRLTALEALSGSTRRLVQSATMMIDPAALQAGNVSAVTEQGSAPVAAATLPDLAAPGPALVVQQREGPQLERLPPALASTTPAGAALDAVRLSQDIFVPNAEGTEYIKTSAWVRDTTGLVFDRATQAFRGTVLVTLAGTKGEPPGTPLGRTVGIAISALGATQISPQPVTTQQLGEWIRVALVVPAPPSPFVVEATADPNQRPDRIELRVIRPQITLSSDAPRIIGWGLGKTLIRIRGEGGDRITLNTSGGSLTGPVVLDAAGDGVVELRSGREPDARIQVLAPYAGDAVSVGFTSPLVFLALAVAGGLLGAAIGRRPRERWPRALGLGAATGLLMAMAYFVGFDWVHRATGWDAIATSGEAIVGVLGALGALLGVQVLTTARPSSH